MRQLLSFALLTLLISSCGENKSTIEVVGVSPTLVASVATQGLQEPPLKLFADVGAIAPITGVATDTFVACPSNRVRVGGGCKCGDDGNITRHLAGAENKWVCSCDNYSDDKGALAYAYCAVDEATTLGEVSSPIDFEDDEYSASCNAGEVAISGGISCGDEGTATPTSLYPVNATTWTGQCDNILSNPKVTAYCTSSTAKAVSGKSTSVVATNFSGKSGVAKCASTGKLISGGCKCPSSTEMDNSYTADMVTWNCFCNGGNDSSTSTAYAMCTQ